MKKQSIFLYLLVLLAFSACQSGGSNAPEAETSEATSDAATASQGAVNYIVNTEASVVEWEGYKPGKYGHNGTIMLKSGNLAVNNGQLESGTFGIDLASISCKDLEGTPDKKAKLEGHLKSPDFLDVEKYPASTFQITKVEAAAGNPNATHNITGNLTLKDITNSIVIPAKVSIQNGSLMAETPEFTIDRTKWKIEYGSGVIGTIQDELIADEIKLKIKLAAAAQAQ
jgi:polyisoprenoid-binding protein YceI